MLEALGDVVVEISDAAFRIGRGDDAQRAAVRQMPHVLLRLDRAIGFVELLLPLPEVLLLGQLARGAQAVEHGGIGRGLVEEAGVELEQRAEGGVVEGELAVDIEDGDAGGELVEHAAVRLDHAVELGAHGLGLGAVDGDAGAAGPARRVDHVEDAALAGDDRRQTAGVGRRRRARCAARRAPSRSSNSSSRATASVASSRFDRARIGGIDEDQPAVRDRAPRPAPAAHRAAPRMVSTSPIELVVAGGQFD